MAKTVSGEDQGDERKRTTDEVSKYRDDVKTGVLAELRDKSRGDLLTVWAASGIKMA